MKLALADQQGNRVTISYQPATVEDLYEIGAIPKWVKLDDLKKAREAALRLDLYSPAVEEEVRPIRQRLAATRRLLNRREAEYFVEARRRAITTEMQARIAASLLSSPYGEKQAQLLGDKIMRIKVTPFYEVYFYPRDLVVETPLILDDTIDMLTARDVYIYSSGRIEVERSHFILHCRRIEGNIQGGA